MCTQAECQRHIGKFVQFKTPYGYHQGVIEQIKGEKAIILSPSRYVPAQLASTELLDDDVKKLDVALAWWRGGLGRAGYPGVAAGGYPRGAYGYGGWGYGWARWAVSFLIIYALFGLWIW
ncbi:hypothetical protein NZD89_28905 (plasmid) [Alicyclobacillus fastidiosus]|uniref:Uncharacterized protein n=1 Tax=Alicyclobacillus fastidiosus TaxID=392011 RepID=A0ABY6ZQ42_9BACL|nr:hypothetical protein [Alicyclobacillus fastidiosus]WAH45004.1 hypothetical protein NZD89_28905 [Alicyclobacillus fastidiosus]GMA66295.1 hypothetical protein GCM10025859_67370 [Alicyclobacillus fastidiosus]